MMLSNASRATAWTLLFFLGAVTTSAILGDEPQREVRVTGRRANVRSGPNGHVVFQAKSGDRLRLIETRGDWYLVESAGGQRGYIYKTLVGVIAPKAVPVTAAAPASATPPPSPPPPRGVTVNHDPVDCIVAEQFTELEAQLDPTEEVARARIYFRAQGAAHWYYVNMASRGAGVAFSGVLPKPKKTTKRIDYYVEALDKTMDERRTGEYSPIVVGSKDECSRKLAAMLPTSMTRLALGSDSPGAPLVPEGFLAVGIAGGVAGAAGSASATTATPATAAPKSSGSKKTLLILGGVALAGGGVAIAAKGGGSSTTGGGGSLTASIASITPSGTALVGATILTFVGAGGAPGATFGWNFGDGSTASGQTATHVYGTEGIFSVVLTVSSGGQAATATGTATAKSITGRWSEDTGATISLTQKGSVFDGIDGGSPLSGMVSDPRHVVWTRQDRCAEHFDLTADSTITTMTGTKNNLNCSPGNVRPATVTRQ